MVRFAVDELRRFTASVLEELGVGEDHARIATERMLDADLRGMVGHGIVRLPQYAGRLRAGGYNLDPRIRVVQETASSALVDGDNALGQVVMTTATELAIEKALDTGIAWVGTRRSNHAGAAGVYAAMGVPHGLIGMYFAVGSANHLPPWGGVDPLLSTNPLAVAIPAGAEPPVVLDMATTVVSYGRIKVAAAREEELPVGWMVDREGNPITDPKRSHDGFLLPIGGYKGYGLGVVIGMLAGVMNGAAFGSAVVDFTRDDTTPTNTGQAVMMLRPDLFRPLEEFTAEMDHRIRELRESTPMPGQPPIRLPGDQAETRREAAQSDGLALAEATVTTLVTLADELNLEHPFGGRG